MAAFVPRTSFPALTSLPRSYYLGHHAAALAGMRALLSDLDLLIECRDIRIPLTSQNPQFEDVLAEKQRIIVYTKTDVASGDANEFTKKLQRLRDFHRPLSVCFSDARSRSDTLHILKQMKRFTKTQWRLTGSHCMVVGMPNVGKSSLLNALRRVGVGKRKAAQTGAQPGVTRKIGTGVKIVDGESDNQSDLYLLDTPGVFIPYVPDAEAMLKLALVGSVKDNVIAPITLADYLLYHINIHDANLYAAYHAPTNDVMQLLEAMARNTGRLQKTGTPDLSGTAMWMIQRWRNGHLGRFLLDDLSDEAIAKHQESSSNPQSSLSQAKKADKEAIRARARSRKSKEKSPLG